jgi:hypothetical protein
MKTEKLSRSVLDYIEKIVGVAKIAGIDTIILEEGKVRGIDEDHTVFILQEKDVPDLPFGAIGMTRIGVWSSRYDIAKATTGHSIEAAIDDEGKDEPSFVRSLTLKGKGIKIDYRCANPKTIKSPRQLADPITHRVQMTADAVNMLTRGQSAMSADDVSFFGSATGVCLEMKDNNSDALTYEFADTISLENGHTVVDFHHHYPIKTLTALFKQNPDGYFQLTTKGMMIITVNDITVVVFPRS